MSQTPTGYTITLSNGAPLGGANNVILDFSSSNPTDLSDSTKTSLSLVRRGSRQYSDIVATDLVHLTENFANGLAPANPLLGQLWFDSANNLVKVYDNSLSWQSVEGGLSSGLSSPITFAVSGDVNGTSTSTNLSGGATITIPVNLNGQPGLAAGTYVVPTLVINSKGIITAASSGSAVGAAAIIAALGYTPADDSKVVHKTGDTMSGTLNAPYLNAQGGKIQENGVALIPSGAIIMWTGSTAPAGWVLCDGGNGTPDLRDRFIVGAGNSYSIGSAGGTASQSTTINNFNHTHTFTTQAGLGTISGSTDAHVLSVGELPAHNHSWGMTSTYGGSDPIVGTSHVPPNLWSDNSGNHYQITLFSGGAAITGSTGSTAGHSHTLSGLNLSHSHTGTTDNPQGGTPSVTFDNRPPYYALAYIMKT